MENEHVVEASEWEHRPARNCPGCGSPDFRWDWKHPKGQTERAGGPGSDILAWHLFCNDCGDKLTILND